MDAKKPPAYVFGRFDWYIEKAVSTSIEVDMIWINLFGVSLESFVIVFFIVKFCQKNTGLREPYYVVYTMGCLVDAVPKLLNFLSTYVIQQNKVMWSFSSFFGWYNSNYMTLWILILAVNRYYAIFYSLDFSRIWSKRNTTIICVFLSLYPFVIHCFNPVYMWCQIIGAYCPRSIKMTAAPTDFEIYFAYISNIIFAVTATAFCVICASRIFRQEQMKNLHIEKVLILQAFTSSVFLLLSTAFSWSASVNGALFGETDKSEIYRAANLQQFLIALSNSFFNLHHYIGLLLMIGFSRTVRTAFIKFYRIDKLRDRIWKPKNKIRTVQVQPAGTKTTEPTQRPSHIRTTTHH